METSSSILKKQAGTLQYRMKQSWRQASMQVLNSSVARPWKLEQNTSGQASRQALRASRLWKLDLQIFFFPPVWPIRTRHGPYNSVSGEKHLEKGLVWSKNAGKSSHQHEQKTKKTQPKRPANPPARFAFRHKANSEATKNGAGPKQEPNQTT